MCNAELKLYKRMSPIMLYKKVYNANTKTMKKQWNNPLEWWVKNDDPILSLLAEKYLAIPATSTPSERAFSASGNVVSARRCCLANQDVDNILFILENARS